MRSVHHKKVIIEPVRDPTSIQNVCNSDRFRSPGGIGNRSTIVFGDIGRGGDLSATKVFL